MICELTISRGGVFIELTSNYRRTLIELLSDSEVTVPQKTEVKIIDRNQLIHRKRSGG